MSSLQSRLFHFMVRNRHLLQFRLKKETWDWNTSVPRFRQECEEGAKKAGKLPEGIQISPVAIPGLPSGLSAEWIYPGPLLPRQGGRHPVIFFTHGGGYVSGSCSDHRFQVAKVVKGSGLPALLYEYRLAPEHPFPAALEDTLVAYRWLLSQEITPDQIIILGESAGGGLGLATLLALRDQQLPLPAAAVAISPWTDLKCSGESYRTNVDICLSPPGMDKVCSKYYAGENDPAIPWISPLYGDLHGLPPLLLYAGEDEIHRDGVISFAEKARAAGVDVTLRVGEGMSHCYPFFAPLFPEATQAMADICAFIVNRASI